MADVNIHVCFIKNLTLALCFQIETPNLFSDAMKRSTIVSFLLRHEFCIYFILALACLLLLSAPLWSDTWVELRLKRVARCSTKDPVNYELGCRKLRWTDHQVARAGLWVVCYSFPKGIVPHLYHKTESYCAEFDDDNVPAPWLDDARSFCILSPVLATWGLIIYTMGNFSGQIYTKQMGHVLFVLSGMTGLVGPLNMFLHMDKAFLIPDRRARVQWLARWPFYWTVVGSLLTATLGLIGHVEKTRYTRVSGQQKEV